MKSIIIFFSKYGTTKKAVDYLNSKLKVNADVKNISTDEVSDLNNYDLIIIGSSIYVGNVNKKVKQFCEDNKNTIKNKSHALFICSGLEGNAVNLFKDNFGELSQDAISNECFGGELLLDKMGFISKTITKMVQKKSEAPLPKLNFEKIDAFANKINEVCFNLSHN